MWIMRWGIMFLAIISFSLIIVFRGIKLGLDLKGGSYFLLEVKGDVAVKNYVERIAGYILKEGFDVLHKDEKIYFPATTDVAEEEKMNKIVKKYNLDFLREEELDKRYKVFKISDREKEEIIDFAVYQALETIRGRVDEFGVAEPQIFKHGKNKIVVQLPGVEDPERAKRIIGKTAQLEFRILDDENTYLLQFKDILEEGIGLSFEPGKGGVQIPYLWSKDMDKLQKFVERITPPVGRVIFIGKEREIWRTYILMEKKELTGEFLRNAVLRMDPRTNNPIILLSFSPEGAKVFEDITQQNVGKRLAIILDEKVYSAPVIRERITGGNAVIEGSFSLEEAREIASILRAGSLPAPVQIEEERTVGPTLGSDSIKKGIIATATGFGLVLAWMGGYYRIYGIVAVIGVSITTLFILAFLSLFGAVLTLPGIAGIALTAGMAVDNNVIILERVRDELKKGSFWIQAVNNGYKNALSAIIDAQITTFISGIMLFQFGTGPVRGFALTLCLGVLGSLFGNVFCTRTIDEFLVRKKIISV